MRTHFPVLVAASLISLISPSCSIHTNKVDNNDNVVTINQDVSGIAADAVSQLTTLYLPAKTRLNLPYEPIDDFGIALAKGLRDAGYAVAEGADNAGYKLRYLCEFDGASNLRVQIYVGTSAICRLYFVKNNSGTATYAPASGWSRMLKEGKNA